MQVKYSEPYRYDPSIEIRHGGASWDNSDNSVKFAYRIPNGHISRQGEVPCHAICQMLEVAIKRDEFDAHELIDLQERINVAVSAALRKIV